MLERINLVPGKPLSEQLKIIVPAILISLLLLIMVVIYLQNRFLTARIERITLETAILQSNQEKANIDLANLRRLAGELDGVQKQKISLLAEVGKIEAIRSRKRRYSLAVNTIAAILPNSLKCEKIAFKGGQGTIEGLALHHRDLPLTVKRLQENPVFLSAFLSDVDKAAEVPSAPLSFRIMVEIE